MLLLRCSLVLAVATAFSPLHHHNHRVVVSSSRTQLDATAIICGASGYIGKSVVRESVAQGYKTIALVRNANKTKQDTNLMQEFFQGAEIVECDVTNPETTQQVFETIAAENDGPIDAVVSCLASRSGVKKDAYLIDYQATLNCLNAGRHVKAKHFCLLSAFCVKNPILQFQKAKLEFEAKLTSQSDMTYTIVRPTAFFKSVSGQLEVVQSGAPFVMFGNGELTQCNPISEAELAEFIMDSVKLEERRNKIINLGGPDDPITMKQQGQLLFEATGKEPKFIYAPVWIFDAIINTLQFLANVTRGEALEDAAETGRIGKYYAVQDMLTTDPKEKYGTITLAEHYQHIAQHGQDYDEYTTMFARARGVDVKSMREEKKMAVSSDAASTL